MINVIIIDDEVAAQQALKNLLALYHPEVKVVALASSVAEAVPLIQSHQPQAIFLDIVMPRAYGFELIKQLAPVNFQIVFTTAHESFAIKAFQFAALDYLLKPIHHEDLARAVARIQQKSSGEHQQKGLDVLQQNFQEEDPQLILPTVDGYTLTRVSEVIYCEADRNYTRFHLLDRKSEYIAKTLKEFEDMLDGLRFMRVHRSFLVNLEHVRKFFRDNRLEMVNGDTISISSKRKDAFLKLFLNRKK
ncbi:MAG: LytTR family DNA-binding domain-containing protein [Bacteroidota bacterium]